MHHIGPYRIEHILAKGARGFVYKGAHEGLGREVAIKALNLSQGIDPEERKRILTEACAQVRLQHPNIVATCDVLEEQGQVFVAMEYVQGTTLDVLLERRGGAGFSLAEALGLFEQVLAALDHARRQGVVHRNIKPSNIMVCEGQVKVMNFAMALFRQPISDSAAYLAPEQLLSTETDHRTDLYCAAVVLYEMLAGRHPFQDASGLDLVQCHLHEVPADLKTLVPDLTAGISMAVAIALEKDPRRRCRTAEDFLRALQEGAVGFLPVVSDPDPSLSRGEVASVQEEDVAFSPPERISPRLSLDRQPRLIAATCILIGLGLLGSYGLWKARYRPPDPSPEPTLPAVLPTPTPSLEPEREEPVPTRSPDPPAVVSSTPEPAVEPTPERRAEPLPPTPSGPDPEEIRRLEVGRLQEEVRQGIESAESDLRAERFDAAQEKLDRITAQAQRYPEEFPGEIARLGDLQGAMTEARARQRELEIRLQHIEKLLKQGKYPEADGLAQELGEEPGVPEAVAARARELSAEAKEELKRIWGTTQTGPTKNKVRRPPGS